MLTLKGNSRNVNTGEVEQIIANYHTVEQHNMILKLDIGKYEEKIVLLSQ